MGGQMQKTGKSAFFISACALALSLSGCGGGSPPSSTPPPPPPPPPNLNDAEYQASIGAVAANALSAYQKDATGRGVKIAIIDSGINAALPEFAGRIDPASTGITDDNGHGTSVALIAAAARNGQLTQGVAYEATILSYDTLTCGLVDCFHRLVDIAQAVDAAVQNGARVINLSLVGETTRTELVQALQRATTVGVIIVIAAGNTGAPDPDGLALLNAQQAGNGLFIIAGTHDANKQIAGFSAKAGAGAQYYIASWGGSTSASTPVISGAAALLAGAFPNLTGAQIVELLLSTAYDAGDPGTDAIYGRGILDIARAFQPQGFTALAGGLAPVSLTDNGASSAPMGDATFGAGGGAIILDGYSRAYALDLARTLSHAPQEQPLRQALDGGVYRTAGVATGPVSVSITMRRNMMGETGVGMTPMSLGYEDSRKAKVIAGMAISRLTPKTALAFGLSESGRALQQQLAGYQNNAFLVARDPMARVGFQPDAGASIGIRHDLGPVALTVTSERGEIYNPGLRQKLGQPNYTISSFMLDRKIGPAKLSLGAARLSEESTILGGRFSSAFSSKGSDTIFMDGAASLDIGKGWGAFASYRRGWTSAPGSGALIDKGRLATNAFAFDLSKTGAFSHNDKIAFRVMQPLRVASGGFNLNMPVSYDYATKSTGYEQRFFNLAPTGREIDYEIAYGVGLLGGLLGGYLGVNAFLRTDPGHVEAMKNDIGAAIRFTLGR
jgi:hypothetical protein